MNKYKNSAFFLLKFFGVYFLLFVLYSSYLKAAQSRTPNFNCAPITTAVANQTESLLRLFNYNVTAVQHDKEMSIKIIVDNVYIARVIEGCNSMSILILFISFIVAFSGPKMLTFVYAIIGSLVIYAINILRIAFLTAMLKAFPEQQLFLHNIVFPSIIYGTTFMLWVVWVRKYSYFKKL